MLQQLANGVFAGSIYALFAIGFTLVFGILRQLNLAHPAIFTGGAFVGIELATRLGLPLWALVPAVAAVGALAGVLLERVAFRPLAGRDDEHFAGLISSVAFGGILIAALQARYGTEPRSFPSGYFPNRLFEFGGISVTLMQLVTLGLALVLMLGLAWLVSSTPMGRAMRAVAENPRAAKVLGVNAGLVTSGTYALSSALGTVAGALLALNLGQADRDLGASIELIGFAVIIVGGLGSLWGAMAAGLILGIAEAMTVSYFDSTWKGLVPFALLFVILVLRPRGLFGAVKVREV
ncbi:branched-chain amino acid ABC transporter permease [Glycomyces harbinensis]|uniref:Branched-chain amino acid transport system permease protein n=1 Tax=Glycomyces harbinensis TaxID=58114 RepID=A0A1G6U3Y5_9ACTN|nr:branched-chain amino acid ABC transporter permease [Glycomyces harbinensis]SDD36110.1 branched-chain amino acid transport system permease protein [Glycomyces harbinensis]